MAGDHDCDSEHHLLPPKVYEFDKKALHNWPDTPDHLLPLQLLLTHRVVYRACPAMHE